MCQRIGRRERSQCQSCSDRLLGAARIAQGPDQPMMRLIVRGVGRNGSAKRRDGLGGRPRREQVETLLRERFGGVSVGRGHGCY